MVVDKEKEAPAVGGDAAPAKPAAASKPGSGSQTKEKVPVPSAASATATATTATATSDETAAAPAAKQPATKEKLVAKLEADAVTRIEEKVKTSSSSVGGGAKSAESASASSTSTSTSTSTSNSGASTSAKSASASTPASAPAAADPAKPPPGWWRPLFIYASVPAVLLAGASLGGVAVESPVWLLGPEGCAMASRRSLARLQGIRGRAAVRWQEATTGGRVVIGLGAAGTVVPSPLGPAADEDAEDGTSTDADEDDDDGDGECAYPGADPERAAINSWSQLRERRNRQPVTIGLGLCVLAAFSGSNTVIYYASSVLADAGLSDPSLLTYAVGIPNLLGAFIALIATDKYGRRPLLLLSFGGMAACLGALSLASALTPGEAVNSFCAVSTPEATSGLPCVTCSTLAAICSDLPPPSTLERLTFEPQRTVALVTIPAYTLLFSLGAGPVPWLLYNEVRSVH
jgi:hypothetical protein